MTINIRFPMAVHLMRALGFVGGKQITPGESEGSFNPSSVFVGRIPANLSESALVSATTGKIGRGFVGENHGSGSNRGFRV